MKKLVIFGATTILGIAFASPSFAQAEKKPAKAEKPATKSPDAAKPAEKAPGGAPGMPEMPKPAPEVAQAAKMMVGTWKCVGTQAASPMGPEHKIEATNTFKLDMDKFFIAMNYVEKKTKLNPMPGKFTEYRTYDPAQKKWVAVGADNMGMVSNTTGEPTEKGVKWEGKSSGSGMSMSMRITEEQKNPKEVHVVGEMQMAGDQAWKPMFEVDCKK